MVRSVSREIGWTVTQAEYTEQVSKYWETTNRADYNMVPHKLIVNFFSSSFIHKLNKSIQVYCSVIPYGLLNYNQRSILDEAFSKLTFLKINMRVKNLIHAIFFTILRSFQIYTKVSNNSTTGSLSYNLPSASSNVNILYDHSTMTKTRKITLIQYY